LACTPLVDESQCSTVRDRYTGRLAADTPGAVWRA
jgi:hypothetical protein